MKNNDILKTIAKKSSLSLNETKMALTALCSGMNVCLMQGLFTLMLPRESQITDETIDTQFTLAGRLAVMRAQEVDNDIWIIVAVPNAQCKAPYYWLDNLGPSLLGRGYDLMCSGFVKRMPHKPYMEGRVVYYAQTSPWTAGLINMEVEPVGYSISTDFTF